MTRQETADARVASRPGPWRRGPVLAAIAVLLGLLMLLHEKVPNRAGNLGSLLETFLPWSGLFVPVLLAGAVWRRSASAAVALLLPVTVWLSLFGGPLGGLLGGASRPAGDLTVVSHNVGADNPDPVGTARDLAASGADMLALLELTPQARGTYEKELARAYPHHAVRGTVGLWSRLPLAGTRPVDTATDYGPLAKTKPVAARMAETRALRTTVATDHGPLAVYVAHLGSVRVSPRTGFGTADRDRGAQALGKAVAAERNERVVLLGDLNGTTDDRAFDGLTQQLRSVQDAAGGGFGFSWPARFPVVRIDQILVRGVEPASSWVLPATGSDHLPVAAGINW
ncbi:endonuclease/exonuclease/phosphatase family protein [Streptomyces sp. NPDC050732]|uniref:endonuclease/exonuclease/phosphatase family protein n=1 Tax=Streptomyces sp. NPDC050732 TaxID=3154632 RepID=UPI003420411E